MRWWLVLALLTAGAGRGGEAAMRVDVRQLGAVGDGVADDAPAIQRALDGGHRTVVIPPGTYRVGTTLWVDSATTIEAELGATIILADHAGTGVDVFVVANRDREAGNQDITITGGTWDGNAASNPRGKEGDPNGYTGSVMNFVNVRRLALRWLTVRNPEAFFIRACRIEDFSIEDIDFVATVVRPNQDGIHLNGFCHRGVIRRLRARTQRTTNDDMVALNADDATDRVINLGMVCGPISDITVDEVQAPDAYTFIRLLTYEQSIENVTISRVSGGCRVNAVNLDRWRFPAGGGHLRNVVLRDFDVRKTDGGAQAEWSNKHPLILVQSAIQGLRIENFRRDPDDATPAPTLLLDNGVPNRLTLDGLNVDQAEALRAASSGVTADMILPLHGPVRRLQLDGPGRVCLPRGGFSLLDLAGGGSTESELAKARSPR